MLVELRWRWISSSKS